METEVRKLKEEVTALAAWLELREGELHRALARQTELLRNLAARSLTAEDLEGERQKLTAINQEQEALSESRRLLEEKRAQFYRLESRMKYLEAAR